MKLAIVTPLFFFMGIITDFIPKPTCKILLNPNFNGKVELFSSTDKKSIIELLVNNIKQEDFIYFEVLNSNDSMFKVSANYSIKGHIANGWIQKNNKSIGIYSRIYDPNDSLVLYYFPNKTSKKIVIKKYFTDLIRVIDCKKTWLKVILFINKKKYQGWMPPEEQCANPYTTCT